jgi:class 3 adenylate cyclase
LVLPPKRCTECGKTIKGRAAARTWDLNLVVCGRCYRRLLNEAFKTPTEEEVENYLHIRNGSISHIPHYAREGALFAIKNVRDMESRHVFRPGLYYIVLSDLSRSTDASARLGQDLNMRRVESFILTCIEALGNIDPRNYFHPIREIGDAVLIIFSSFADVLAWWAKMHEWLAVSNFQWQGELPPADFKHFLLEAKTVVHVGEVAYSSENIPIAQAVNQVFKIEKLFKPGELGVTEATRRSASPILAEWKMRSRGRAEVVLPGDKVPTRTYVVNRWTQKIIER